MISICSQLYFTTVYRYHYKSRIKYLVEKIPPEKFSTRRKKASPIPREYSTLFIYLGFYVAFNTVQVLSRRVVGRAEETSTYSVVAPVHLHNLICKLFLLFSQSVAYTRI